MSGTVDPSKALEMWSDHWLYPSLRRMIHPALTDASIWLVAPDDDATVCMAALAAMIRCSELVIADVPQPERLRMVLARCYAVAEACGRSASTFSVDSQTVVRFEMSVLA